MKGKCQLKPQKKQNKSYIQFFAKATEKKSCWSGGKGLLCYLNYRENLSYIPDFIKA